jgi:phosphoserine phosphatase
MRARPIARSEPRVGAFFDMDKTLISENSGTLYMKYRYQRGEVDRWDILKGLGAYLRYKLGVLDIQTWTREMMVQFRGQSERALTREANRWFRELVDETIYPEAEELVREHQASGHIVAIVSGSTKFSSKSTGSTWPRASSTPTPSRICPFSTSSGIRWW